MKKLIFLLIIAACAVACEEEKVPGSPRKYELRKFNVKNSEGSSGWYFLVAGGYTTSEQSTVRLYYKETNGEYTFMEKPLDAIVIKIENTKEPYLTHPYNWKSTIHCREEDFQPEVNINSLK